MGSINHTNFTTFFNNPSLIIRFFNERTSNLQGEDLQSRINTQTVTLRMADTSTHASSVSSSSSRGGSQVGAEAELPLCTLQLETLISQRRQE